MISRPSHRATSVVARLASLAVATAGLAALSSPARAGAAEPAQRATSNVAGATFTWGLSGYAQKGIFGPWTYKDLTGDATQLTGSVSGGDQSDYVVDPVPATSMPVSDPQQSPNAIRFTEGTGTADPATGAAHLTWEGSYTVNAYPVMYGAPDEIYSDPELTIAADGSGSLTMDLTIGAGVDMEGDPTPAVDLGRLAIIDYAAGSATEISDGDYRYTPAYQGNEVAISSGTPQVTGCTSDGGSTGWWGAWPDAFVNAVPDSIRPHFYSTGCGGLQDNKAPLPIDVTFDNPGTVEVSDTTLLPDGTQTVTVTGSGFDPELAIGTRPPFQGAQSGVYIAFGRYLDLWRPSQGAPSGNRVNPAGANGTGVAVKWAVPAASFPGPYNQDPASPSYTELRTDGTFTTTLSVDQSWLSASPGNFGIYTYAGGGPTVASYETYTPITFAKATPVLTIDAPKRVYGQTSAVAVSVATAGSDIGAVTLTRHGTSADTAELESGTATFDLGRLAAGSYPLVATFSGNGSTDESSATVTLRVAKATSKTKTNVLKKPTTKKSGRVKVTISSPTTKPDGKIVVKVKNTRNKVIKTLRTTLKRGTATFALPRGSAGRYGLVAIYPGTGDIHASRRSTTYTVR